MIAPIPVIHCSTSSPKQAHVVPEPSCAYMSATPTSRPNAPRAREARFYKSPATNRTGYARLSFYRLQAMYGCQADHWSNALHLLTLGHGYTADALARQVIAAGGTVTAATRSTEKWESLAAQGYHAKLWHDIKAADVQAATAILLSAAPKPDGDPVFNALPDVFRGPLPNLTWLGYLSTIAVYGNHDGAWVDETTPLTPTSQRGTYRVAAEEVWQSLTHLPVHIFRLGGIYGPTRGPFEKVRAGKARRIIKEGQFFNRAHVADIADALWASIHMPTEGEAYNITDNLPAPPQDVLSYAAELLNMPPLEDIPFETADMSPMGRAFYEENKRVRNDKLKNALGWTPQFPTYREGLEDILAQMDQ